MKVPPGYTEDQIVQIIDRIGGRLADIFRFGYHEREDMKQEAAVLALEGLDSYDKVRPLENFLWVHIKNRLHNFKRNNYARPDKPCDNCPFNAYVNGECTKHDNMMDCEPFSKWTLRNETKKHLMSTKTYNETAKDTSLSIEEDILSRELFQLIDDSLPVSMREDWIRFSYKLKLPKTKRETLLETIREILERNGIDAT